ITTQPATTNICGAVGSTASMSVATNVPVSSYSWQYRVPTTANPNPAWITITAANAAVYSNYDTATLGITKTSTLPAKGTQYRVLINEGDCGILASDLASINIITAVKAGSITVPSTSVCLGGNLTMTLTGYVGTSFQWQSASYSSTTAPGTFADIDGATGTTYTLTNAQLNSDRSYRVIVTNSCDNTTATSATKTITVNPTSVAGTIISGGGTVCEGASGSMKVAGYVGKTQWQYSEDGVTYYDAPKASAVPVGLAFNTTSVSSTGATYVVTNITADLYFRVKVTSGVCSSAYTAPVQYVIGTTPLVGTASSASSPLCAGTGTTLNLSSATGVISWKKTTNGGATWSAIANSNSLSIPTGNLSVTTTFKAVVSIGGTCGEVESNLVVVNVDKVSKGGTVSTVVAGTEACSGVVKQLKVASNVGSIQWQSSPDNNVFTDIDGATSAIYNAVITTPTWFRVKATSGVCSSAYSNAIQLTLSAPAVAGTLSGANATVCSGTGTSLSLSGTTNGTLVWQKSTNWTSATPTWSAISATLIINNQFSTGNLSASTAYRVVATNVACVDYSNVYVVTVNAKPVAKSITANVTTPAGTAATSALCTDNSVAKVLTIGAGSVGTIQWETVVSATAPTASTVWTPIEGATGTSYTITNPSNGVNYFRAKFSNGVCADVYSAAFKVYYKDCVPPAKVSTAVPFAVVAYPNPYSDNFHLNLTTSSEERVGVSIYDMTGKLLDKLEVGATEASELSIGDRYASGVYNVVVTQGNEVKTLRVVKR
ncbi:T9SS type A sorting domain-containing protein, partial [Flavobacterium silvisoli]